MVLAEANNIVYIQRLTLITPKDGPIVLGLTPPVSALSMQAFMFNR